MVQSINQKTEPEQFKAKQVRKKTSSYAVSIECKFVTWASKNDYITRRPGVSLH